MKKILFLFVFSTILLAPRVYADERHDIHLCNEGKTKETIEIKGAYDNDICRIEASLREVDDDGGYTIDLTLENQDDKYVIYLFRKANTRKQLRKSFSPMIIYDRGFKERYTQGCKLLDFDNRESVRLLPGESDILKVRNYGNDQIFECVIPLYFAKSAGYLLKRHQLMDVRTEVLNITVEIKPSQEFIDLSNSVENLINTISNKKYVVCKHGGKQHNESLENQKDETRLMIDSMSKIISAEMAMVRKNSRRYYEYQQLLSKIKAVDVDIIPVESCKSTGSLCSCPSSVVNMSLSQILHRMEELYQTIYLGKKTKDAVIGEVRTLKVHAGHIQKDPNRLKGSIERYYERINKL
jgi:hypothetical protein